jgi:hypothetical protein
MSRHSADIIPEKDTQTRDDTERPATASKSPSDAGGETDMTGGIRGTANAVDMEPTSERPAAAGKKYSFFTTTEKRAIVLAAATGAFFSPLSAQIYFPALNALSRDLHVSVTEINLTVTTYMVG